MRTVSTTTPAFWYDFLVEGVSCGPLEDPRRMVLYAADMLEFEVAAYTCDPGGRRFRAEVRGAEEALARLASLVGGAFPEARVQVEPATAPTTR